MTKGFPTGFAVRCAAAAALAIALWSPAFAARVIHAPGGGAVRALVMGIDKYSALDAEAQLRGAKADADDIAAALTAAGVAKANVVELADDQVVRSRIVTEMDRLVAAAKSGDLVIIAYSGHGMKVRGYKRWDGKNRDPFHSQMALSDFSPVDANKGHEVIVDAEMRAWYARLDAKGVDMLVVMDTCYGGHMRGVSVGSAGLRTRELNASVDDRIHDSFVPITMNEAEASADPNGMKHLTFLAGASGDSTVPEMGGIDRRHPDQTRGALSYFLSRIIDGGVARDGTAVPGRNGAVSRGELYRFLSPVVREATDARQFIDFGPRPRDGDTPEQTEAAQRQPVFIITDSSAGGDPQPPDPETPPTETAQAQAAAAGAVRVAISNGPREKFNSIVKGKAPFVQSQPAEAEVIWDVAGGRALTQGDLLMEGVDESVLGRIIDRTYAVREIKKLAVARIIDVKMGDGRAYTLNETPKLVANGVNGNWLTVVNIAADGTLQRLFPFHPGDNPRMAQDQWTYSPRVDLPFGTDYTVVVATTAARPGLNDWLRDHNNMRDAFDAVAVLRDTFKADQQARLGTAGLFTRSAQQ